MKNVQHYLWIVILGITIAACQITAMPKTIAIKSTLKYSGGGYLNGSKDVHAALVSDTSGEIFWEELHSNILFLDGRFKIELGSETSIPIDQLKQDDVFLKITVEGSSMFIPLVATPYSLIADHAKRVDEVQWDAVINPPSLNALAGYIDTEQLRDESITNEKIVTVDASKVMGHISVDEVEIESIILNKGFLRQLHTDTISDGDVTSQLANESINNNTGSAFIVKANDSDIHGQLKAYKDTTGTHRVVMGSESDTDVSIIRNGLSAITITDDTFQLDSRYRLSGDGSELHNIQAKNIHGQLSIHALDLSKNDLIDMGLPSSDTTLSDDDVKAIIADTPIDASLIQHGKLNMDRIADDSVPIEKIQGEIPFSKLAMSLDDLTKIGVASNTESEIQGQYVFRADPTGSGINQGSVYIRPIVVNPNDTLLGIGTGGNNRDRFRVDAEGDVYIAGELNASGYTPDTWNEAASWGNHQKEAYLKSVRNEDIDASTKIDFSKLNISKTDLVTIGLPSSDTTLSETDVDLMVANNGYLTSITKDQIATLGFLDSPPTEDDIDEMVENNGYLKTVKNEDIVSDAGISFSKLLIRKTDITSLGIPDRQLNESEVDTFVANNGFILTSDPRLSNRREPSIANEVNGDIMIFQNGSWVRLALGAPNQYLGSIGGSIQWVTPIYPKNTLSDAGIVAAGQGNANKVWKTDSTGIPAWREDRVLSESDVDQFVNNNGYLTSISKQDIIDLDFPVRQLNESEVDTFVANNGFILNTDTRLTDARHPKVSGERNGDLLVFMDDEWKRLGAGSAGQQLSIVDGHPSWINPLSEDNIDAFVANNGYITKDNNYLTQVRNDDIVSGAGISFSKLAISKTDIISLGIPSRMLIENEVDQFVENNGYQRSDQVQSAITSSLRLYSPSDTYASGGSNSGNSGATRIGVFDALIYANGSNVQSVLEDFDGHLDTLTASLSGKEPTFPKNNAFNRSFGSSAGTIAEGNHDHDNRYYTREILDDKLNLKEPTFSKNSAFNKDFGTSAGTIAAGNHDHDNRYFLETELSTGGSNAGSSGASLIGVFDEFSLSNATTVQEVLDDLDHVLSQVQSSSEPKFSKNDAFNKAFGQAAGTVAEGNHHHDDRYYSQSTIDAELAKKEPLFAKLSGFNKAFGTSEGTVAEGNHTHDNRYFTETELSSGGSNASTSGATRIGVFDEFQFSDGTQIQTVLNDLDQILAQLNTTVGNKEAAFSKKTAFNKNFGTDKGTVAEGSHIHDDRYYTETEADARFYPLDHAGTMASQNASSVVIKGGSATLKLATIDVLNVKSLNIITEDQGSLPSNVALQPHKEDKDVYYTTVREYFQTFDNQNLTNDDVTLSLPIDTNLNIKSVTILVKRDDGVIHPYHHQNRYKKEWLEGLSRSESSVTLSRPDIWIIRPNTNGQYNLVLDIDKYSYYKYTDGYSSVTLAISIEYY